jgi:hypothetical protein
VLQFIWTYGWPFPWQGALAVLLLRAYLGRWWWYFVVVLLGSLIVIAPGILTASLGNMNWWGFGWSYLIACASGLSGLALIWGLVRVRRVSGA